MPFYAAIVNIRDFNSTGYVYQRIGGQPSIMTITLARTLQIGRRGLTTARFIARFCAAVGLNSIRNTLVNETEPGSEHDFEYNIDLSAPRPRILVTGYSNDHPPQILYKGYLENYLTKELRRPAKRRGRTPPGFDTHEDFVRSIEHPERHNLRDEILNERARSEAPRVNLRGVRIISKKEHFSRVAEKRRITENK